MPDTSSRSADIELLHAGYRYALSLTHDSHDAEDLIQQACLRLYKSRGGFVSKSFLFTTIRNLHIDACRRRDRVVMEPLTESELAGPTQCHTTAVEDRAEVQYLLSRLRSEEREALFLNCVEGFTAAEISQLTGQPRGTILSLLSRAKKKLAERFDSTVAEEEPT